MVSITLLWLIALNVTITSWLIATRGTFSVALAFFDLGMDLAYGFVGVAAAVILSQQVSDVGAADAPLMLSATGLDDILLLAFPFLLLRIHLPANVRAAHEQLEQPTTVLPTTALPPALGLPTTVAHQTETDDTPPSKKPARCCGVPQRAVKALQTLAVVALTVVSLGGAGWGTANVMRAREIDPDCKLIDELCAVRNYADDFNYTMLGADGLYAMMIFSLRMLPMKTPNGTFPLYNRTVVSLSGECMCALPSLFGTVGGISSGGERRLSEVESSLGLQRGSDERRLSEALSQCVFEGGCPRPGGYDWTTVPEAMFHRCKGVEELDLTGNNLTSLPAAVGRFRSVKELTLNGNALTELPPEIGELGQLTVLSVSDNALTSLPTEIGLLTNVKALVLGDNALTTVPSEIGRLPSLVRLEITGNALTSLPTEIGQLTSLKTMVVDYTDALDALAPFLTNLPDLNLCRNKGKEGGGQERCQTMGNLVDEHGGFGGFSYTYDSEDHLCEDTCDAYPHYYGSSSKHASNDGVCDDGGPGSAFSACGLGSDCTDCGRRSRPSPPSPPPPPDSYSYSYSYSYDTTPPSPPGCSTGAPCTEGSVCNFDSGSTGFCESCDELRHSGPDGNSYVWDCDNVDNDNGVEECIQRCDATPRAPPSPPQTEPAGPPSPPQPPSPSQPQASYSYDDCDDSNDTPFRGDDCDCDQDGSTSDTYDDCTYSYDEGDEGER